MRKRKNLDQDYSRSSNLNNQTNQSVFSASSFPVQQSTNQNQSSTSAFAADTQTNQNLSSADKLQRQISHRSSNFDKISLTAGELDKSKNITTQPIINKRGIQLDREEQNIERQKNPSPMVRSIRENMIQKHNDSFSREISSPNQVIQRVLFDKDGKTMYSESSPTKEDHRKFKSKDDAFITLVRAKSLPHHYMVYIETSDRPGAVLTDLGNVNGFASIGLAELKPGEAAPRMASKGIDYKRTWSLTKDKAEKAYGRAKNLKKRADNQELIYTRTGFNFLSQNDLKNKENYYNCVKYAEQLLQAAELIETLTIEPENQNEKYEYRGRILPRRLSSLGSLRRKSLPHHGRLKTFSGEETTLPSWTHNQSNFLEKIKNASPAYNQDSKELKSIGKTFEKYHQNIYLTIRIKNLDKIYEQTIKYITKKSQNRTEGLLEDTTIKFLANKFSQVMLKELSMLRHNMNNELNYLIPEQKKIRKLYFNANNKLRKHNGRRQKNNSPQQENNSPQQESEELKVIQEEVNQKKFTLDSISTSIKSIQDDLEKTVIPLTVQFSLLVEGGINEGLLKEFIDFSEDEIDKYANTFKQIVETKRIEIVLNPNIENRKPVWDDFNDNDFSQKNLGEREQNMFKYWLKKKVRLETTKKSTAQPKLGGKIRYMTENEEEKQLTVHEVFKDKFYALEDINDFNLDKPFIELRNDQYSSMGQYSGKLPRGKWNYGWKQDDNVNWDYEHGVNRPRGKSLSKNLAGVKENPQELEFGVDFENIDLLEQGGKGKNIKVNNSLSIDLNQNKQGITFNDDESEVKNNQPELNDHQPIELINNQPELNDNSRLNQGNRKSLKELEKKFIPSKKKWYSKWGRSIHRGLDNLHYGRRALFNAHNNIYKRTVDWKREKPTLKPHYDTLGLPYKTPLSDTLKRYEQLNEEYDKGIEFAQKTSQKTKEAIERYKVEQKNSNERNHKNMIQRGVDRFTKEEREADRAVNLFKKRKNEIKHAKNEIGLKLSSRKKHNRKRYFFRWGGKAVSAIPNFLYGGSKMVANIFTSPWQTTKALARILAGPIYSEGGITPWFKNRIARPIASMVLYNSKEFKAYLAGGALTNKVVGLGFNILGSFIHNFAHHFMRLVEGITSLASWIRIVSFGIGLAAAFIPGLNVAVPILAGIGTVSGAISLLGKSIVAPLGLLLDIWDEYTQIRLHQNIKKMEGRKGDKSRRDMENNMLEWVRKRYGNGPEEVLESLKNQKGTLMENQALAEYLGKKRLFSALGPNIVRGAYRGLNKNSNDDGAIYKGKYNQGFEGWRKGANKATKDWYDLGKSSVNAGWDNAKAVVQTPGQIYHEGKDMIEPGELPRSVNSNKYKSTLWSQSKEKLALGILRDKVGYNIVRNQFLKHAGIEAGDDKQVGDKTYTKPWNQTYREKEILKQELFGRQNILGDPQRARSSSVVQMKEQPGANSLQLDPQENENPTSFNEIFPLQGKITIQRYPDLDPIPPQENNDSRLAKREEFIKDKIIGMKGGGTKMILNAVTLFSKVHSLGKALNNSNPAIKKMNPELQEKFGKVQQTLEPGFDVNIMDEGGKKVKDVLNAIH